MGLKYRGPEATTPLSFTDSSENGFFLRSPHLAIPPTDVVKSQASLVPRTRHPVRMIIVGYYPLWAESRISSWHEVVRPSSTCLEVGIKKLMPTIESSPKAVLDPAALSTAPVFEGSPQLQQICDRVYKSWQVRRGFCDPAHRKIDLYMDCKALNGGMTGQKTVLWRCDDEDVISATSEDGWDLNAETRNLLEAEKPM